MVDVAELGLSVRSDGVVVANRRLDALERQAKKTERASDKLVRSFRRMAARATALVGALAAVSGALALRAFLEYERQLTEVEKQTNLSGAALRSLAADVDRLAVRLVGSASEILDIVAAAAQVGVTGRKNLLAFAETVTKLGIASDITGDQAVIALAKVLNITGEAMDSVGTLASVVVKLGAASAASESELLMFSQRLARAGSLVGMTSSEVIALSAAMIDMGIRAEEGSGVMLRTFQEIEKAIREAGEGAVALSNLTGIAQDQLQQAFDENALQFFLQLLRGMKEAEAAGRNVNAIFEQLDFTGTRASAVIGPLSQQVEVLAGHMRTAADETANSTALTSEYEKKVDDLGNILSTTRDRLQLLGRSITATTESQFSQWLISVNDALLVLSNNAEKLVSVVGSLVKWITALIALRVAAWFVNWTRATVAATAANIAFAASTVKLAGGGGVMMLAKNTPKATMAMNKLRAGVSALGAGLLRLIGGPVGLAIAGLAALGLGIRNRIEGLDELSKISGQTAAAIDRASLSFSKSAEQMAEDTRAALEQVRREYEKTQQAAEQFFNRQIAGAGAKTFVGSGELADLQAMNDKMGELAGSSAFLNVKLAILEGTLGTLYDAARKAWTQTQQNIETQKEIDQSVKDWLETTGRQIQRIKDQTLEIEEGRIAVIRATEARKAAAASTDELKAKVHAHADALVAAVQVMNDAQAAQQGLNNSLDDGGASFDQFKQRIDSIMDSLFPLEAKLQRLREMEVMIEVAVAFKGLDPAAGEAALAQIAKLREELMAGDEETFLDRLMQQIDDFDVSPLERQMETLRDAIHGAFGPATQEEIEAMTAQLERLKDIQAQRQFTQDVRNLQVAFRGFAQAAEEGSGAQKALAIAAAATNAILGIQAVLNQGGGDPYSAFFRMAAMAGIVASLGVQIGSIAGSGGSNIAADRQASQGTGSVLGDPTAKSESIANAMEIVAGATTELVGINRAMLFALRGLNNAITGASVAIAQMTAPTFEHGALDTTGLENLSQFDPFAELVDIFGLFHGDSEIVDQGIQLLGGALVDIIQGTVARAFQTIESSEGFLGDLFGGGPNISEAFADFDQGINRQFQLILQSIVDTVEAAAVALGFSLESVQARIAQFQIEAQKISLKDMTLEEQQAAIQAVFSKIFDDLAGFVIPWIDEFQRAGEGLGETLVRVATSVQVMQEAVRRLGFSAERVDPHQFAQISVALIELAGGIEEFISQMQSFLDAFAPDAHLFQVASSDINRALAQLGLETIPATREEFFALMQSFDATTEQGRQAIATILSITDAADTFYSRLEELRDRLEDINDAIRELAIAGRDFQFDIAQRIANITGDTAGLLDVASNNLDAARINLINATDPVARMAAAEQFINRVATWLQVATQRIQSQIQALEAEANEILERGRARGQAAAQAAQAVAQAQQQARQAELDSVNAQLEAMEGWMDVLDGVKQLMDDLTFSRANPASGFSRLQMLNQRLAGLGTADTPEEAAKIQELLKKRLDLGQQLFQRPSQEYQQLFNDTMSRLAEMRDKAKSFEEVITDLQEKANELQKQTAAAISAGTGAAIILSSKERQRLEEIRDEQEALRQEQKAVNARAVEYYEWAADVYATAQQARHDELVAEANRIQALLGPDSFIVHELQDIEDAVLGLGNNPPPAPGVPIPGPTPGPGPGGPRIPQNQPQPVTNNVVVNFKGSGNNKRDAKQMATFIKRELQTA